MYVVTKQDIENVRNTIKSLGLKATVKRASTKYYPYFYVTPRKGVDIYEIARQLKNKGYVLNPIWEESIKKETLHLGTQANLLFINNRP